MTVVRIISAAMTRFPANELGIRLDALRGLLLSEYGLELEEIVAIENAALAEYLPKPAVASEKWIGNAPSLNGVSENLDEQYEAVMQLLNASVTGPQTRIWLEEILEQLVEYLRRNCPKHNPQVFSGKTPN